jgi:hypothetical protein
LTLAGLCPKFFCLVATKAVGPGEVIVVTADEVGGVGSEGRSASSPNPNKVEGFTAVGGVPGVDGMTGNEEITCVV